MSYRLGVDVGGTFTDLLLFDEMTGETILEKTPSTLDNQAIGIINGLDKIRDRLGIQPREISFFMHGTTVWLVTFICSPVSLCVWYLSIFAS